jgi:hypothetical protein
MENYPEREFFEGSNEDAVENFDILNHKNNLEERNKVVSEDINDKETNIISAYKMLIQPSDLILENLSGEYEYKQRETDPYQRILTLKEELLTVKDQIDEYVEKFKDNKFLRETDNFDNVLEELDLYKTKIDAFINYDVFNNLDNLKNADEDDSASSNSSTKNEFYSLFEKYNRITENLISQIKLSENDVINQNSRDINIKYEIYANPEMQMENLLNRITELEDLVTNLERTIGNWNIVSC